MFSSFEVVIVCAMSVTAGMFVGYYLLGRTASSTSRIVFYDDGAIDKDKLPKVTGIEYVPVVLTGGDNVESHVMEIET